MSEQLSDSELLKVLVSNLVDYPDAVSIERITDEKGVLLTLHLDARDMGKIIGKSGGTAQAIRLLLRGKGRHDNSSVSMKIAEPERAQGYGFVAPETV